MSRRLQIVNLLGVLALAALCVFQWQRDRRLNLELAANEKVRQAQERQLADNASTLTGLSDDLARFKADYAAARAEATESRDKLRAAERANEQLTGACEQLKESVTNWVAAVAARDQRLAEANTRLRDLATQLNESVSKYNSLATNFNGLVEQLNAARASKPAPQ